MNKNGLGLLCLALVLVFFSGCATVTHRTNPRFTQYLEKPVRVAVMPPDVKISEFTAGGMQLYKEDWSGEAKNNVIAAIKEADPQVPQLEFFFFASSALNEEDKLDLKSQQGLLNLAAQSIIDHTYMPVTTIPDKVKNFDYTLGAEFAKISQYLDADAVLYCSGRNYIWTAGRAMMYLFASAVFGGSAAAMVPVGSEYFLMSIVDVKSGDVIWFDYQQMQGDLRDPQVSKKLIGRMLGDIPKALARKKAEHK